MITVDHFTFTRHRSGSSDLAFRPDAGASLLFASMADDTLALSGMRAGVLQVGDEVSVARGGSAVFRGAVSERAWHGWRGSSVEESFSACGPWRRLSRLPFTQLWALMVEREVEGLTVSALEPVGTSRVVLNQGADGSPITVRAQVAEILAAAADAGIIAEPASGDLDAIPAALTLPFDEARDLTCAQALARELRFTPALAVRFDYSQNPPALRIIAPAEENAGWLADVALDGSLLDVADTQSGLPPLGCLLEIQVSGSVDGTAYEFSSFQAAGDTSDPERTLRAVLPVSGAESSADRRSLDLVTHEIPADLDDAAFWRLWHHDLKLLPAGGLVIRDASRTGGGDLSLYPRFVATAGIGLGELEEAGIAHFRTERLLCTAVITTSVYLGEGQTVERVETADLSLEIIATDAETHLYRWTASSDATSGETVPAGLAAALLAAHQADGASAALACALKTGAALPLPGDTRNGLTAHTVSVDCRSLTAQVSFGPPASLGPVDLAGFLSGFRNLRRSTISVRRATGESASGPEADQTAMLPSTSSGWIKRADNKIEVAADGGTGGKAVIDPSGMTAGTSAELRDLTFTPAGGSATTIKALLTAPVTIPPSSASPDVTVAAATDAGTLTSNPVFLFGLSVDATDKHKLKPTTKALSSLTMTDGINKSMTLIPSHLEQNEELKVRTLTFTNAAGYTAAVRFLSTYAVAIPDIGDVLIVQNGLAVSATSPITYVESLSRTRGTITANRKTIAISAAGIPSGYEEETLNIVTDAGIVTRTVLVKTATKASVESFASGDSRLLLSINASGLVRKSKGYLKS